MDCESFSKKTSPPGLSRIRDNSWWLLTKHNWIPNISSLGITGSGRIQNISQSSLTGRGRLLNVCHVSCMYRVRIFGSCINRYPAGLFGPSRTLVYIVHFTLFYIIEHFILTDVKFRKVLVQWQDMSLCQSNWSCQGLEIMNCFSLKMIWDWNCLLDTIWECLRVQLSLRFCNYWLKFYTET